MRPLKLLLFFFDVLLLSLLSSHLCSSKADIVLPSPARPAICGGTWIDSKTSHGGDYMSMKIGRNAFANISDIKEEPSVCPFESFYHNCLYHGIKDRAGMLLKREWKLASNSATNTCPLGIYSPRVFLTAARNKRITFIGDSVSSQIFKALTCSLLTVVNASDTSSSFKWFDYHGSNRFIRYDSTLCPLGGQHCVLQGGHLFIKSFNVTIRHSTISGHYEKNQLENLIFAANKIVDADDIFIYNFGLHYEYDQDLKRDALLFLNDCSNLLHKNGSHFMPRIYFLQSTPQHFPHRASSEINGYYLGSEPADKCVALNMSNIESIRMADWRNRVVDNVFEEMGNNKIKVIKIADALYSQFDAHISGDSKVINFQHHADCTHWCSQSTGVFSYILSVITNALFA